MIDVHDEQGRTVFSQSPSL